MDQTAACVECGEPFAITDDDQQFYAARGFALPRRCKPCRAMRRAERYAAELRAGAPDPEPR